jgi:ribosomal protein S14
LKEKIISDEVPADLSRLKIKELAWKGFLTGVKRSSW